MIHLTNDDIYIYINLVYIFWRIIAFHIPIYNQFQGRIRIFVVEDIVYLCSKNVSQAKSLYI